MLSMYIHFNTINYPLWPQPHNEFLQPPNPLKKYFILFAMSTDWDTNGEVRSRIQSALAALQKGRPPEDVQEYLRQAMVAFETVWKAREQKRRIQQEVTLLSHANRCEDTKCRSSNCAKMKALLRHGARCKTRASGGCTTCRRIWGLLHTHALHCRVANGRCSVPRCADLKKHIRERRDQAEQAKQSSKKRKRESD